MRHSCLKTCFPLAPKHFHTGFSESIVGNAENAAHSDAFSSCIPEFPFLQDSFSKTCTYAQAAPDSISDTLSTFPHSSAATAGYEIHYFFLEAVSVALAQSPVPLPVPFQKFPLRSHVFRSHKTVFSH
jgi:hypothetical protein